MLVDIKHNKSVTTIVSHHLKTHEGEGNSQVQLVQGRDTSEQQECKTPAEEEEFSPKGMQTNSTEQINLKEYQGRKSTSSGIEDPRGGGGSRKREIIKVRIDCGGRKRKEK